MCTRQLQLSDDCMFRPSWAYTISRLQALQTRGGWVPTVSPIPTRVAGDWGRRQGHSPGVLGGHVTTQIPKVLQEQVPSWAYFNPLPPPGIPGFSMFGHVPVRRPARPSPGLSGPLLRHRPSQLGYGHIHITCWALTYDINEDRCAKRARGDALK